MVGNMDTMSGFEISAGAIANNSGTIDIIAIDKVWGLLVDGVAQLLNERTINVASGPTMTALN